MKVLFVHQKLWPYVERDLRILREKHEVREVHYRGLSDLPGIYQGVQWCDLVFTWFGSLHAFFAVLFAQRLCKRSLIVVGGWDVGNSPDSMVHRRSRGWCPRYVTSRVDKVLFVSHFSREESLANLGNRVKDWGMIYHGFEVDRFAPRSGKKQPGTVLMVSTLARYSRKNKGLDLLVDTARSLPDLTFWVAGGWEDGTVRQLRSKASSNLSFLGFVSDPELLSLYRTAQVYVQPSLHEAFGCAVAEAMLCECVPVVSSRGALPEVVGECGFYVEHTSSDLAATIGQALLHPEIGHAARRRIVREFPYERRRDRLLATIDALMARA